MKEFEKQRTDDIKECRERVRGEERRVAVEEGRGKEGLEGKERKSPRVFGPCLPSSFVPELRLFSWPSFSRFVHPWAQGRARAKARGKARARKRAIPSGGREEPAGKRTKYGRGGEGGLAETWQREGRRGEGGRECGRGRGARRHVRLAVQPTTEATSAGEGIP